MSIVRGPHFVDLGHLNRQDPGLARTSAHWAYLERSDVHSSHLFLGNLPWAWRPSSVQASPSPSALPPVGLSMAHIASAEARHLGVWLVFGLALGLALALDLALVVAFDLRIESADVRKHVVLGPKLAV